MRWVGEIASLGAALTWAVAVILFRQSGRRISPFSLNLFRVGLSTLVLGGILLTIGPGAGESASIRDLLLLAASGIIGIAISDTFFHRGLNITGAGINAVVDTLYSPLTAITAFLLLGEKLRPLQILGMMLVIGGIIISTRSTPPQGISRARLLEGVFWGVCAMATLALGIVLAKPVLESHSVLWASVIRQAASFLVMAPIAVLSKDRKVIWGVFRPGKDWRYSLPGTLLGSVVALLLWLVGMKYINAGSAAILNQTSTIFVLILASVFLGEAFTLRRWIAAGLSLGGIFLVTLS